MARRKQRQVMTQVNATQVRLRFAKQGDLRLVSHHDIMRCLERTARRARIPLATSQGFNPRPKIVFALALGLGIEALREVVDLEFDEPVAPEEILRRLTAASPPGLRWLEAHGLSRGESPPRPKAVTYLIEIPSDRVELASTALQKFLESPTWPYQRQRPDKIVSLDLRPFVIDAALSPVGKLTFRLKVTPEGTARGEEIVEALGLADLLQSGTVLVRSDIELSSPPPRTPSIRSQEGTSTNDALKKDQTDLSVMIPAAPSRPAGQASVASLPGDAPPELAPHNTAPRSRPDGISNEDHSIPNTANRSVQKETA